MLRCGTVHGTRRDVWRARGEAVVSGQRRPRCAKSCCACVRLCKERGEGDEKK